MTPTASIIMPTYNRATMLPSVIASILNQDFADFELVIVDDGSTDYTADVISELQTHDSRLCYVSLPENRGIGYARDAGLQYASGKYIALADSDDLWLPGRLKTQVEVLEKYLEIDMLFGDFLNINHISRTEVLGLVESQKGLELVTTRKIEDKLFLVESGLEIGILKSNFIATPTMVLRRDVFDRIGSFNPDLRTQEDLEFWWRAAVRGIRYAYIDYPLIERHQRIDSVTAQGDKSWLQRLPAIAVMYQTCQKAGQLELLKHIRSAELRTYNNLLHIYGERNQRLQAIRAYMNSLRRGFSVRTSALLVLSLIGSSAISFAQKLQTRQKRVGV